MTWQFNPETGRRGIEWCDITINPIGGCFHRCMWEMPDGKIIVCYAGTAAESVAQSAFPKGFEHHYWRPQQLKALTSYKKHDLLVFTDSMSDMFGHWVPEWQVKEILATMASVPNHTHQVLTKAAPQLLKHAHLFPKNMWVGVSSPPDFMMPKTDNPDLALKGLEIPTAKRLTIRSQIAYVRKALEVLRDVKRISGCTVWMSLEPVSWDLAPHMQEHGLDWVVIGAASDGRRYYQPDANHIRNLLDLFDRTGTPVFFKGNLSWQPRREDFPVVPGWDAAVRQRQVMAKKHDWPLNEFLRE